jgi:hypothetical protein
MAITAVNRIVSHSLAALLLAYLFVLAGGAALRESPTVDEFAHVGAGLSYWQKLDLRLNAEHPPLGKLIAAVPLVLRGTHADYTGTAWKESESVFSAYTAQWMFGDAVLGRWNEWKTTVNWARFPMLLLTLLLGWVIYIYGTRLGGPAGGLLSLAVYVSCPIFLAVGPLVVTDIPVTLFSLVALWQLAEIWVLPSSRNALLLGLAVAGAVLSKFTGLLLLGVVLVVFLQTRFWPTSIEPPEKLERKAWRRLRWRAVLRGLLWAGFFVYLVYLVFSWNQPNNALDRVGSGPWAEPVRRILMPAWLYVRGVALMLLFSSRSTFLLGQTYSHGVPFYFPVVLVLKSAPGFLALLGLGVVAAILYRRSKAGSGGVIPAEVRPHWRVLMIGLAVFTAACLVSRLNIGARHFSIPLVLIILMLALVPRILGKLPRPKLLQSAVGALALSCLFTSARAYPFYIPYVNSLGMGRPAYWLVNASNVDWNQALPELSDFVRGQKLAQIKLDWVSLSDPATIVPEAVPWDCQAAGPEDAGQWVAVAATMILEYHNCGWLEQHPRVSLGGGSMYAIRLPERIPPGPLQRKLLFDLPLDLRALAVDVARHPDKLPKALEEMMQKINGEAQSKTGK